MHPHDPTHGSHSLPVELYRPIARFVDEKNALCILCLASKTWYTEVMPSLYGSVSVSTGNYLDWCNTIIEKPFLGELVHSFSIIFLPKRKRDINYLVIRLALALRNLINLETLAISNGEGCEITTCQVLPAFVACSLDLRRFDCQIPWPYPSDIMTLFAFLERRPGITEFYCEPEHPDLYTPREVIVPVPLLANLTHLSCSVDLFTGLTVTPALESLQVDCGAGVEPQLLLSTLIRVQKTLRNLCLRRSTPSPFLFASEQILAGDVVRRIAEGVPMLHSLCVHDDSMRTYVRRSQLDDLVSSFAQFPQLEIISCSSYAHKSTVLIPPIDPFALSPIEVAGRFLGALPSVRTVTIPVWDRSQLCYARSGVSSSPVLGTTCEETCLGCRP
ncbi:hypothetical protein JAAARDRAFT_637593 [Jaapia argillacea MUCL 33604]|uniref:F-box domain-containing protein n=1 Tax=Jaapia argillacea MUCL 33604 TaxID=933084 RepID=A0A067PYT0_9AGAM|nr:hypothetical protein JAAARDRAFT_637593 [Jaapia argillacea MUCL 33604]